MAEPDDLRHRATRSVAWVVLERWGSRLLTLVVLGVLTRLLDPSQFGTVSFATSVLALVVVFVDSGLSKTLIQMRVVGKKDASTAFWTSLAIALILALLVVLSAPLLSTWFDEPGLAPILQVLSLTLPLSALSQVPVALLERDLNFKPLSIRQLIGATAGASVAIPVAVMGGGVWALVLQSVVGAAAAAIALWSSTTWRPRFEFSVSSLRSMWGFGVSILCIDLLDAVQANIDKIVIGIFFSPEQLGYYFIAQRVGTILIELVTSVLSRVSLTTFSRVQDDLPRLDRIFRQMTFAASIVSIFVFGSLAALAPQIIDFAFGAGWQPAVLYLWILAPGWALGAIMYFDRSVLLATRNARPALLLSLVQNIFGTALVFAFVPLGVVGVAFSRLARFAIWPLRLWTIRRYASVKISLYLLQLMRALAAGAPVVAGIFLLQLTPWARADHSFWIFAVPCLVAGAVVYAALAVALAGRENRSVLLRIYRDARRRGGPVASVD